MLIIYAHPNHDGHCGKILKEIKHSLEKVNQEYEVLDLYALGYESALKASEHYTSGNREVSEENKKIQEKLAREQKLIFIYPTWWNNMPAILKGFCDRVFTAHFAYKYVGSMPIGLLKNKALIFTSTGGPWIYTRLVAGNRAVKVLQRDTLRFCGIKSKSYVIDMAKELTEKQERKIEKVVEKAMVKFIKK